MLYTLRFFSLQNAVCFIILTCLFPVLFTFYTQSVLKLKNNNSGAKGLIIVFLILSFLEIRAERRQKSISVEFSFATVFAFKHHVSAAYVIVLLTIR